MTLKFSFFFFFETNLLLFFYRIHLIAAIHSGKYPYDISKYWDPEVLVIDDLQYVAGKDTTQEEFYNILKRRLEQKKLTVVFSEYPLSRMRGAMRDELIHLLRAGLHTDSDI